ncbi:MAG: hypothetical protein E7241_03340 [Lachnospiraceae bacterium]|nr:hypothetical protein [Lachnospiraceae bacterium]
MGFRDMSKGKKVYLGIIAGAIILAILSALLAARAFFLAVIGIIFIMISFIPQVVYKRKVKETPVMLLFTFVGISLLVIGITIMAFGNRNPGVLVMVGMYIFVIAWIILGIVLIRKSMGGKKLQDMADEYDAKRAMQEQNKEAGIVVVEEPKVPQPSLNEEGGRNRLLLILGVICIFSGVVVMILINTLLSGINAI